VNASARRVEAEILDELPPEDPAARASRRDLRLLNRFLGNWEWTLGLLRRRLRPHQRIVELGAGEGAWGRYLWGRRDRLPPFAYTGVDRSPRPAGWPGAWDWEQRDLREGWGRDGPPDLLLVHLLLHHFEDGELAALGELFRPVSLWVFCEPRRVRWTRTKDFLLRLGGAHPVTRHDARVSVAAGFRGEELPELLAAGDPGRRMRVEESPRGAYRLEAWREESAS